MKKITLLLLIGILSISCNKNKSTIRTLDGKWNASSVFVTFEGITVNIIDSDLEVNFIFEKCNTKYRASCDLIYETSQGINMLSEIKQYKVLDNGTRLAIIESDGSSTLYNVDFVSALEVTLTSNSGLKETYTLIKRD